MSGQTAGTQAPFETTSNVDVTVWDRLRRFAEVWIYAPAQIIREDWRGRVGVAIITMFVLMGTVGVAVVDEPSYAQGDRNLNVFEDLDYPLGTDGRGVSYFAMIAYSTPQILLMVLAGAVFTTAMAAMVGVVSGFLLGTVDRVLMTISDTAMAIPSLPLIIVVASIIEPKNPLLVGIILSINAWAGLARTVRSQALSIREESYVEASRIMDIDLSRIVALDILPNIMPYVAVNFMRSGRRVIFQAIALYYLGVLPYSQDNWGTLLNRAFQQGNIWNWDVSYAFWVPLSAVILLSLGLILLSQSLDAVFNPRVRARHVTDADQPRAETN